jgi:hypothetical protein
VYASTTHQLFGDTLSWVVSIAAGITLATLILLSDSVLIVAGSDFRQGLSSLRFSGYEIPSRIGQTIVGIVALGGRLAVAVANAQLTTGLICLIIFAADIDAAMHAKFLSANAVPRAAATDKIIGQERSLEAQIGVLENQVALSSKQEAQLRSTIVTEADDPAIKLQTDLLSGLIAAKAEADRELAEAELFASNELGGIRGLPGNSGKAGVGPVRGAALERVANARARVARLDAEMTAADAKLRELQERASDAASTRNTEAGKQLSDLIRDRQALEASLADLRSQLDQLKANREAAIGAAVERDPAFVPEEKGFLARVRTLSDLADEPRIAAAIILLDIVFFTLEVSAVLGRVLQTTPSVYAAKLAWTTYQAILGTATTLPPPPPPKGPGGDPVLPSPPLTDGPDGGGGGGAAPVEPTIAPMPEEEPETAKFDPPFGEAPVNPPPAEGGPEDTLSVDPPANVADASSVVPFGSATVKRGRGRPLGSKTKPKAPSTNVNDDAGDPSANPQGNDGSQRDKPDEGRDKE